MVRLKKDGTPAKKPGRKTTRPPKVKKNPEDRWGPRPHVWKVGPDEFRHSIYHPWQMSKAQAVFRGEVWNLEFEDYFDMWKDLWEHRGRGSDDYCQSRIDPNGPWDKKNTVIITRKQHLQNQRINKETGNIKYGTKRPGRPKKTEIVYTKVRV